VQPDPDAEGAAVWRLSDRASNTGIEKMVSERSCSKGIDRLSASERPTTWIFSPSGDRR
jgi:hypothetical protein